MKSKKESHFLLFLMLITVSFATGCYGTGYYYVIYKPNMAQINANDYISQRHFKEAEIEFISEEKVGNDTFMNYKSKKIQVIKSRLTNTSADLEGLFHEYGHYIWFEVLTDEEREIYTSICRGSIEFQSIYSIEGGTLEDFAEAYRFYMLYPGGRLPDDRTHFMNKMKNKYPCHY